MTQSFCPHSVSHTIKLDDVGFLDNLETFQGNPGLASRDGIHATLDGAAFISGQIY